MSTTAIRQLPAYLREARLKTGCVNRGTAATKVPYSPETIGRHERGEVPVSPEDVVMYAEAYDQPAILLQYCSECLVGCYLHPKPNEREFAWTALKMSNRLKQAVTYAQRLDTIADDNRVDADERVDFNEILTFMFSLESMAADLRLYALQNGIVGLEDIKRAAPVAPGSDSARR